MFCNVNETKGNYYIVYNRVLINCAVLAIQISANDYAAPGINAKVYFLAADSIGFDILLYVFNSFRNQITVSRSLEISPYFYRNKINGYGL